MNPLSVELIGCGAVAAWAYQPALAALERAGRVRVAALADPDPARRAELARTFPAARAVETLEQLPLNPGALAVLATPPALHAPQAVALLGAGRHVLCEKPLARSAAEAETMVAAARAAGRLLAAGQIRRFFPAARALREWLRAETLGAARRVEVAEGGRFNWQSASPALFERECGGGVLLDLGSHVVDLLCDFFGAPAVTGAESDALGGVETNARLELSWPGGLTAHMRLSWDTPLPTGWRILTARGEFRWDGGADGALEIRASGGQSWLCAHPQSAPGAGAEAEGGYAAAFARQLDNVLEAIAGRAPLEAAAESVVPGLRVFDEVRRRARLLPQPWLSPAEQQRAEALFTP